MGNEGGTKMTSSTVIRQAQQQHDTRDSTTCARSDSENAQVEHTRRWTYCALSKKLLVPPLMCDKLGNIFLKESVLEFLIGKKQQQQQQQQQVVEISSSIQQAIAQGQFSHLKKMSKDVCEIKISADVAAAASASVSSEKDVASLFKCAVHGTLPPQAFTSAPFFVRWNCGHILSAQAVNDAVALEKAEQKNNHTQQKSKNSTTTTTNSKIMLNFCPVSACCDAAKEHPSELVLLVPPEATIAAVTSTTAITTSASAAVATATTDRRRERE